ncbi:chemotaxis protein CheX [Sulfurospirillum oryzae]|uniref:chemotaxis protein CheX n=1 Tax=Sulfurospirillum oryzae TaxID=2976535 RepID=UPI0021E8EF72|nr:chemotaxis protein CheX [Sulfurospirillum oryzae]
MKNAVIEATENFCSTILCELPQLVENFGKEFYGSAISLIENECEHTWYLLFEKSALNEIAKNLLFEDNLCEDDLDDLLKEISNQIIGSAKVILEAKNPHIDYHLNVPEFMGNVSAPFPISFQETFPYQVKNSTFIIGR